MSDVAEPGLLVRARADGREDCLRAQWGGSDRVLAAVLDRGVAVPLAADWTLARRAVSRSVWLADLDCLRLSAVYLEDDRTRTFLPLWAGLPTAGVGVDPRAGPLVRVRSLGQARHLRRRWRRLKGGLAEAVADGRLPFAAVPLAFRGALVGHETLDGALFEG